MRGPRTVTVATREGQSELHSHGSAPGMDSLYIFINSRRSRAVDIMCRAFEASHLSALYYFLIYPRLKRFQPCALSLNPSISICLTFNDPNLKVFPHAHQQHSISAAVRMSTATVGLTLVSAIVLLSNAHIASAQPPTSFSDILLPSPNITGGPAGEIQCYALPYGAIGIISHLLTYWTIAWMAVGQTPLWPWHPLKTYKFDMFLAVLALCTCIPIASIAMHRCRLSWHFLLICIWKLVTSVSLAIITIHRCIIIRRIKKESATRLGRHVECYNSADSSGFFSDSEPQEPTRRNYAPLWWLILYLAGTIIGMVGLCSLLYTTFRKDTTIRHLTYGFGAAMAILPMMVAIYWFVRHLDRKEGGGRVCFSAFWQTFGGAILAFTAVFGFFSSLYSDLVLGAIADNIYGWPNRDFAPLYWAWFVAKRLTLLSF